MPKATFSGSRVYGKPGADSDLDLLMLVTPEELGLLRTMQDHPDRASQLSSNRPYYSLRFGNLNVIATTDPKMYAAWTEATQELSAVGPVDRDYACRTFQHYEGAIPR